MFVDKTLLIADFLRSKTDVSLILRPRRFGKSTNLTMLRDFFAFPVHPDSLELRKELFKETKILKLEADLCAEHFCRFPVLYLSFKVGHLNSCIHLSLSCWFIFCACLIGHSWSNLGRDAGKPCSIFCRSVCRLHLCHRSTHHTRENRISWHIFSKSSNRSKNCSF